MRYYVIVRGGSEGPWVVAETPDDAIAEELAGTFIDGVVLTAQEAVLDPDFVACARAWEDGDDRVWRVMRDEADAFDVIEEVWDSYLESNMQDDATAPGED